MKHAFCLVATFTIIAVAGIGRANAQVLSTSKFDIPFDFTVNGKAMPSGSYTIDWHSLPPSGLVEITSKEAKIGAIFLVIPTQTTPAPMQSELVFYRSVNGYSLRNVWSDDLAMGGELPMTKKEQRLQRELAANGRTNDRVVVVSKK